MEKTQLDQVLSHVHIWLRQNADRVSAAYMGIVDRQTVFFITPHGRKMDFDLSDAIAALEVQLVRDFPNYPCEARQIPGHSIEVLSTFVDLETALQVHGEPPGAGSHAA